MLRHVRNFRRRAEARPSENSCASHAEVIVLRFPQSQSNQLLVHPAVDLRPKRAHNVFAGGRNFAEILGLKIQMSILPEFNRIAQRFSECDEIVKRSASFIVIPAKGRFSQIKMAVTARVVAFPKQGRVLFVGKRWDMQSMSGAETHLHSEKHARASPGFSEEICAFVQTDSMNWNRCHHPFANVSSQAFGGNRPILQSGTVFVEMAM